MFERFTESFYESLTIVKLCGVLTKELLAMVYTDGRSLLHNPEFKLIQVERRKHPDDEVKMKLVVPADDWLLRRRIELTDYYCVSHVWGPPSEWETWTDHGILDEDGVTPLTVRIRPDKKKRLLDLLAEKGGLWWVDIFCAQHATPLGIMGKIYQFCGETYCLLDCEPTSIKTLVDSGFCETLRNKMANEKEALVDGYLAQIDGHEEDETAVDWEGVVEDVVGWWYRAEKISVDDDEDDSSSSSSSNGMVAATSFSANDVLDALCSILKCEWFTRVWTLQEAVLPTKVSFLAESGNCYETLDRETDMNDIMQACHTIVNEASLKTNMSNARARITLDKVYLMWRIQGEMLSDLYGTYLTHTYSEHDTMPRLIRTLALEPRRCLDPRDYVYGVTGVLCLSIPKLQDPAEVWNALLDAIQERSPRITLPPRDLNLADAKHLSEVFSQFDLDQLRELE